MLVKSYDVMEFRGVTTKNGKNGEYYLANFELADTEAVQFYLGNKKDLVKDLKKGDMCECVFDYDTRYKDLRLFDVVPVGV